MRRFAWSFLPLLVFLAFLMPSRVSAQACADGVAVGDLGQMDTIAQNNSGLAGVDDPTKWTCQSVSIQSQRDKCVSSTTCQNGGMCCPPSIGGSGQPSQPAAAQPQPAAGAGGLMRLIPPACYNSGDCSLDDIIRTAVEFVNLLFRISGAILLLIFVYAGCLYLVGGVSPDGIAKAKKMMTGSVIGIIIMFGAHTLIRFFADAFLGR